MKKLVIISHTAHRQTTSGYIAGWGPTVAEINFLAQFWEEIIHVACVEQGEPAGSALPYTAKNIKLAGIPYFGGRNWKEKLSVITTAPRMLRTISNALQGASHVQLRLPMGIGIYLIPYLALAHKRTFLLWVKYANNWGAKSPPPGYRIQRWMLKKNWLRCKVTINGAWPAQPSHCISFENPCLTTSDLSDGEAICASKRYDEGFRLLFIGRLEAEKGLPELLHALQANRDQNIQGVDFIGEGPLEAMLRRSTADLPFPVRFHGFLPGPAVRSLLAGAHFLLLPSRSEGFPKVVAEGLCYGCVPVVSDVGSIPHYIHNGNGFLWAREGGSTYAAVLADALSCPPERLKLKSLKGYELAKRFSFEYYV
ncbi:MAG: glycosyltransferase family 4 protein, partial [Saprospiraceae bacterium]